MQSNRSNAQAIKTAYCKAVSSEDTAAIQKLWETCFDDTGDFVQWYFEHYYRPKQTLGMVADDRIVASAQVIPYDITLRGKTVPTGYVVGVDTDPDYRHRGYARTLLLECLKKMRRDNMPISYLMPFEGRFYYRYGWQYVCFQNVARCKPEELSVTARQWGTLKGIRAEDAKEYVEEMDKIYRIFTADFDGTVLRTPQKWQDTLTDMEMEHGVCYLLYHPESDELMGYCYYLVQKDHRVLIPEIAWVSEPARKALLWYLTDLVPEGDTLEIRLPAEDSLIYELATDKQAVTLEPFVMARIVDVKQCLEMVCTGNPGQHLTMLVQDAFAEWNNGIYRLFCEKDGKMSVSREEASDSDACRNAADLEIDIEGLTLLVMGSRSVQQLIKADMLKIYNPAALQTLQALFPKTTLFFNEYY